MSVAAEIAKKLTWEDIKDLPEDHGRTEILDGDLFVSPIPHRNHQRIATNFTLEIVPFVRGRDLGEFYGGPIHCILDEHVNVEPDLCFIAKDRYGIFDGGVVRGAPDLVIEILSPSNRTHDTRVKFGYYQRHGVREYWIVDPRAQSISVYFLEDGAYQLLGELHAGQTVETRVLTGFELDPARIF